MANEATCFSLTSVELAAAGSELAGGDNVDVATTNAAVMTADVDVGVYILKSAYESGVGGKSRLLRHLKQLEAKIIESAWPAI